MNRLKTFGFAAALAFVAAQVPTTAHALVKWTLDGNTSNCTSGCGSTYSFEKVFDPSLGSGATVSVTSWANTLDSDTTLHQSHVAQWGSNGLGVRYLDPGSGDESTGSPQHTLDNVDRFELMLFEFKDQADPSKLIEITLSKVILGWQQSDSDISVLAYEGTGDPTVDLEGVEYHAGGQGLTGTGGWTLVGNYDVDSTAPSTEEDINTTIKSSYWLVGAYNPVFPGCVTGGNCNGPDSYPDYVKLLALKGDVFPPDDPPDDPPSEVPEPTTLLLLATALPLLRRRKHPAPA